MESLPIELLWRSALAVIPLALIVAAVCRWTPCRPATRHTLWLVVLMLLVAAPLLPRVTLPQLPAGPPAATVDAPPREFPIRREGEAIAPTASSGPPATASLDAPRQSVTVWDREPAAPLPRRSSLVIPRRPVAHPIESAPRETLAEPVGRRGAFGISVPAPAEKPLPVPKPAAPLIAPEVRPRAPSGVSGDPEFKNDRGSMAAVPPDPRTQPAAAGDAWRQWMVQLGAIRDAVMSLPPIPARVWLGGIVALLLVGVLRIERSRRVVRAARAAPPSVDRMVAEASRELGLRRPPVTLMVDLAVSPMLWCGRRVRLVLPRPLWAQLDDVSRRAVICHELAHLRRRDHWVCRAEMIIGWVYWWHPVVWWVRRRLREEADLSCDAWVTALWPNDRRSYAQALLETRRCSNTDFPAVPSVGLGATTTRARRFARRLTMVMTAQNSPRISRKGVVLAGVLAMGGVLVTPIWACPEADKDPCETSKPAKAPKADKKMVLVVPPEPARPPKPPKPPKAPQAGTTFERFMLGQEGETESVEQRIKGLERQLEQLHKELQKILRDMPDSAAPAPRRGVSQAPMGRAVPSREARGGGVGAYAAPGPTIGFSAGDTGACLRGGGPCTGGVVIRTYKLPEGKLEMLTELMIRSDVPIRVRPGETEIEVHATPAEHCVFDAFCTMVNGKDRKKAYKLSEGKLKALTEFMVRSDVPILVEPGKEGITVHGTDLELIVFGAFVNMLQPGAGGEARATAGGDAAHAYAKALADLAHEYESHAVSQMADMSSMKAALRAYEQQFKAFERQAEKMQREADRLEEKADQLEDRADEMMDKAEEARGQRRNELMVKAQALMQQADSLRQQAETVEAQAEELEAQAEEIEDQAEEIEDEMEELEELAEAQED
ncbi:MAG: M56 family metallopeptidase [Planctomycetota bacterium]